MRQPCIGTSVLGIDKVATDYVVNGTGLIVVTLSLQLLLDLWRWVQERSGAQCRTVAVALAVQTCLGH